MFVVLHIGELVDISPLANMQIFSIDASQQLSGCLPIQDGRASGHSAASQQYATNRPRTRRCPQRAGFELVETFGRATL